MKSKPGRKKGSTVRRTAIALGIAKGMPPSAAAKVVGMSRQNGRATFKAVVQNLLPLMDEIGLTDRYILEQLKETTQADRVELAQYKGQFTDIATVPDNPTRVKALETAAKIRRMYPEREQEEDSASTVAVQIITNVKLDEP